MSVTFETIKDQTEAYAETFIKQVDLALIVKNFVKYHGLNNVYVFDYLGWLPFGKRTSLRKIRSMKLWNKNVLLSSAGRPNTSYRYNIGILNISYGYRDGMSLDSINDLDEDGNIGPNALIPHYLGYILDNETMEIWLLDSITPDTLNQNDTGFVSFAKAIYPDYVRRGMQICSGCGNYEPLTDHDMQEQNIFCHTWTMYFIFMILKGIRLGYSIEDSVDNLNQTCDTPRANLIKVKQFAYYMVKNFASNFPLHKDFLNIYIPSDQSGLGVVEHIIKLQSSPEFQRILSPVEESPQLVLDSPEYIDSPPASTGWFSSLNFFS